MDMSIKTCSKCGLEKSVDCFYRNGKESACKKCVQIQQRKYQLSNPEKCREIKRKYDIKNKDILNEKNKQYHKSSPHKRILTMAKYRAKLKSLPFNLSISDIIIPEFCPVLGLKLQVSDTGKQNDYSPSLDRIIPSEGYIRGNVNIISNRANVIKNCGSIEEHMKIVDYINKHLTSQQKLDL